MSDDPKTTYFLLSVNILFYLILAYLSSSWLTIDRYWMAKFGLNKALFLSGAYYQVLTSMFAHFDFTHLGYNMIFLAIFGAKAEDIYGGKRLLSIYVLCGVFASSVHFIYPLGTISAGASGAIYGILGTVLIANRNLYSGGISMSLFYGFVFFILAATTGFLAHLVGLIFGFLLGFWITRDWYPKEEDPEIDEFLELLELE
ncbi:MAG: rhomboid family intramembrane serine protease [Candidatus Hydrothermarchaeales archaeon]